MKVYLILSDDNSPEAVLSSKRKAIKWMSDHRLVKSKQSDFYVDANSPDVDDDIAQGYFYFIEQREVL